MYDFQCTIKGCPSVDEVKCVQSTWHGTSTNVDVNYLTFTERMPLSLNHEVPEPTQIECPTTSALVETETGTRTDSTETLETGSGTDSTDTPEETGSDGGDGDEDEGSEGAEGGEDGESAAFTNGPPPMGLVAGAVAGAAVVVL